MIAILLWMIFLHVLDDFCLQASCLVNLKQKKWWMAHPDYQKKYQYDYLVGLAMHSFSWTFMIMLPILLQHQNIVTIPMLCFYIFNTVVHFVTDDFKANQLKINLVVDQTIHVLQILLTFFILYIIF